MYRSYDLTTGDIRRILKTKDLKKVLKIPVDDLRIFLENEERREFFSKEGIKNLYAGICESVVIDYKTEHKFSLFRINNYERVVKSQREKDLEAFMGSEFFLNVSGMRSKEHAIATIEQTMIEARARQEAKETRV